MAQICVTLYTAKKFLEAWTFRNKNDSTNIF